MKLMAFVATTNQERARAFYQDTLSLTPLSEDSFALMFDAYGTPLRVTSVQEFTPAKYTVLGWQVEDISKAMDELERKGVKFERYGFPGQDDRGIWTAPGGTRVAWFKDPDGNVLSLSEHK